MNEISTIITPHEARQLVKITKEIYILQKVNKCGNIIWMDFLNCAQFPSIDKICYNDTFIITYKITNECAFDNFIKKYYKKIRSMLYDDK